MFLFFAYINYKCKFLRTPNTIHIDFDAQPLAFIITCFILLFVLFWAYIGNTRIVNYLFNYKFIDSIYRNFEYKALNYFLLYEGLLRLSPNWFKIIFLNKYTICLFVIGIWSTIGMRIFGWTHNVFYF